jgi:anion-transporting  ArsA/GET3 family ATPase
MRETDLIFVTGKGGTGKTAVAAALGLAAAARGRRTLVCDLGGGRLPAAFGRDEERGEVELADRFASLRIDPRLALTEWMRRQPGGAVAAAVLGRSQAFTHFVDAAPGAKELVTIGKVVDLARDRSDLDVVIADAPSTGHALAMLSDPRTVANVTPLGPIGAQARALDAFLRDPERTGYVGVALPEEMPLHELLDLDDGLHEAVGRGLDLIVVNGVYPDRFTDAEADRLRALARRGPGAAQLRAALDEHRQARIHADRVAWLLEHTRTPVVTLPFVFTEMSPAELERLASIVSRSPASGVPRRAGRVRSA